MPSLTISWLIQGGMIVSFAGIAWRVIRRLNREESLHADYPPHRHIFNPNNPSRGCQIIYPSEYRPTHIE